MVRLGWAGERRRSCNRVSGCVKVRSLMAELLDCDAGSLDIVEYCTVLKVGLKSIPSRCLK